uniref:DUF4838 domain-containing protein n=1 Tax=Panagrellus redivivus TaxID=6233 RepID=A0A7E4UTN5_PANRE
MFLYDLPELLTKSLTHELSVGISGEVGKLLDLVNLDDSVSYDKMKNYSDLKSRNQKLFTLSLNSVFDHNLDAFRPIIQTWQQHYFGKFVTFDKRECGCNACNNLDSSVLNYRYNIVFTNQPESTYQEPSLSDKLYYYRQNALVSFVVTGILVYKFWF